LKTADSGYLTRKLADVAQNVVVTMHDCGTVQGVTKSKVVRGEQVEVRLLDSINGRVARASIMDPFRDEMIVRENEMITPDIARRIEAMNIDKLQVRSPMTCEAPLGVCRLCYGMDMSTGALVEEGMAVGIIAAQSIGEPGTQLTMRTFHIGGSVSKASVESDLKAKTGGIVKMIRMNTVQNEDGQEIALTRNGEIALMDKADREIDTYSVPAGSSLMVKEGETVKEGQVLCQWNPYAIPILTEKGGKVRFEDIIEGETMRMEKDSGNQTRMTIIDHKGDLHPQIAIESETGEQAEFVYLPERATLLVKDGEVVTAGKIMAEMPREAGGVSDITGGLPRITEIFEARKPKDPAVVAEIDGTVELLSQRKRGKRAIIVRSDSGIEREHLVPHGKRFLVHTND
ncbi:MAG: DNA-directed RNA polymerase subunit beta', partial [Planctomycetota bacterium]